MTPLISVIMPAYNAERYIADAIESVLAQTFTDFELLVIDDGSVDRTSEIVASFSDPRIKLHRNSQNLLLAATLNRGLELACGVYIARMDADDLALPNRFSIQAEYLDRHTDVDLVGAGVIRFHAHDLLGIPSRPVTDPHLLRWRQHFSNQVNHPTVMFRRESLKRLNLRYGHIPAWARVSQDTLHEVGHMSEDYLLFGLLALRGNLRNLPDILLRYRVHAQSVSSSNADAQAAMAKGVSRILFEYVIGDAVSEEVAAVCYHTRYQPASAQVVFEACELIDLSAAAHAERYALPAASLSRLYRDADLRKRAIRRASMSFAATILEFLARPILPRDGDEWRLVIRLFVREKFITQFKAIRASALALSNSLLKLV